MYKELSDGGGLTLTMMGGKTIYGSMVIGNCLENTKEGVSHASTHSRHERLTNFTSETSLLTSSGLLR